MIKNLHCDLCDKSFVFMANDRFDLVLSNMFGVSWPSECVQNVQFHRFIANPNCW